MSRRIDPNLHKSKTISKQTYQKIVHRNIQRADNLRAIRLYKSLYFFLFLGLLLYTYRVWPRKGTMCSYFQYGGSRPYIMYVY